MTLDCTTLLEKKNLLAFSAGVDSSALFFLLIENKIDFDIAIVNYGMRTDSNIEVEHAKALAKKYHLTCHTINAPKYEGGFEKNAREFRYQFFETLIKDNDYKNLLTAHQLNDQLEWLLMRLSKGAGVSELLGLEPRIQKENYLLLRPLLEYSKEELLSYLSEHDYPYFIDESNSDDTYERNRFRHSFSDLFMAKYSEGVKRSFQYLRKDKEELGKGYEIICNVQSLRVIQLHNPNSKAKAADIIFKQLGYLLSAAQRQEITKEKSLVIGGEWAVELQDTLLYIAPYETVDMPKEFKEHYRINKVPTKIRPYLYKQKIDPTSLITNASLFT